MTGKDRSPLRLEGVGIDGICAFVPANAVANDDRIARTTGIAQRRIASPGTTPVNLCVQAATRVLADTGARPDEFGAVIFVSFTQRDRMPCGAAQAQARLDLPPNVIAFDVSLACSGWGYGLYLAGLLVRETGRKVLLLDGDVQSAFLDPDDSTTSPLLADGGTATIISPRDDEAPPWHFAFAADGVKGDALRLQDGDHIRMDGFGVFRFVATDVVREVRTFMERVDADLPGSADAFVAHQANVYMVHQLAKSLGFDERRTPISCDTLGNLASASVPTTIAAKSVYGRVLFSGFGGGLSTAVGLIDISPSCRLSLVHNR